MEFYLLFTGLDSDLDSPCVFGALQVWIKLDETSWIIAVLLKTPWRRTSAGLPRRSGRSLKYFIWSGLLQAPSREVSGLVWSEVISSAGGGRGHREIISLGLFGRLEEAAEQIQLVRGSVGPSNYCWLIFEGTAHTWKPQHCILEVWEREHHGEQITVSTSSRSSGARGAELWCSRPSGPPEVMVSACVMDIVQVVQGNGS